MGMEEPNGFPAARTSKVESAECRLKNGLGLLSGHPSRVLGFCYCTESDRSQDIEDSESGNPVQNHKKKI